MKRLFIICLSFCISLVAGLSMPSFADDTDIYFLRSTKGLDEEGRPNILFMFDNSSSMLFDMRDDEGYPTGVQRIDVLQDALLQMLNEIHNVNIGFARFYNEPKMTQVANVPINFPVSYIDQRVSEIEGDINDSVVDITSRVTTSADDAEENINSKKVKLSDKTLDMTQLSTIEEPDGVKVEIPIKRGINNAMQLSSGKVQRGGSSLSLGESEGDSTLVALRFEDVNLPQGATIQKAEVEFTSAETYGEDESVADLFVYAGANDGTRSDPSGTRFSTTTNYISNNFPGPNTEAQPEPKATEGVAWTVSEAVLQAGQTFKTPDIKNAVQEVTDRPGWESGNDVVILFKNRFQNTTGGRAFYGFDAAELDAVPPVLRIYWELSGGTVTSLVEKNQDCRSEYSTSQSSRARLGKEYYRKKWEKTQVGLHFRDVSIPAGAQISSAKITLTHQDGPKQEEENKNLNLVIYGEDTANSNKFSNLDKIAPRPRTAANIAWNNVPITSVEEQFETPDISSILQSIIDKADWQKGNEISIIIESEQATMTDSDGFRKIVCPSDYGTSFRDSASVMPGPDTLPQLEVTFSVSGASGDGDDAAGDAQLIGLRFENIDIPQGATIAKAYIDFTSANVSEESTTLLIGIEDTSNAEPFLTEEENISSRPIAQEIPWDVEPWVAENITYTTPDISELLQKVVNKSEWCGGRDAIAFVIRGEGDNPLRLAKSYDDEPRKAPLLNVEFELDPEKMADTAGCFFQNYSGQVAYEEDDAEEKTSGAETGRVYKTSSVLELGQTKSGGSYEARRVGLRFRDIPVSNTAKIHKAYFTFTAQRDRDGTTELKIMGAQIADGDPFKDNDYNLTQRTRVISETANWSIEEPWQRNKTYRSVDITSLVQKMIEQPEWETYGALTFFIDGSSGQRDVYSFSAPALAPILHIQVEGYLGEEGEGNFMTVRRRLKRLASVHGIQGLALTNLVDSLYESALYFRGDDVYHGKTRHNTAEFLVSHPASHDGEVYTPKDCSLLKPFADECAPEEVKGPARYKSPMTSVCQPNYLVLLTDGAATANVSRQEALELTGATTWQKEYPDPEAESDATADLIEVTRNQRGGLELAAFIHNEDQSDALKGKQTITLHTIGFQLGQGWKEVRKPVLEDGEPVYQMNNKGGYKLDGDGNKIPVTKLVEYEEDEKQTEENIYAVKFLKALSIVGGGKFFSADSVEELVEAFKNIVTEALTESTAFAAPAVSINLFNNLSHRNEIYYALFKPDSHQRWAGNIKKYGLLGGEVVDVNKAKIIDRNYQIKETAKSYWGEADAPPDGPDVMVGGAGEKMPSSGGRAIYTYLDDVSAGQNHKVELFPGHRIENYVSEPAFAEALSNREGKPSAAEVAEIVNWIKGQDVTDEDNDGDTTDDRWKFADPLHSSPQIVSYGGTEEEPILKLFISTNDGQLHMFDANTGEEEWAFLPKALLPIQTALMENMQANERIYGLDGTPTVFVFSSDGNNVIDNPESDAAWLYVGMRRGGSNYYALDVTFPNAPKLMWTVEGGQPPFDKLGQTWSRPKTAVINYNGKKKVVLVFGGGYHESQDTSFGMPTHQETQGGNAIYMLDPRTGELLWSAGKEQPEQGSFLQLENMIYPIPSEIGLIDSNGDAVIDRFYVGDLGGQVWRIDLGNLGDGESGVGAVLADVNDGNPAAGQRGFFYPPAWTWLEDSEYSNYGQYDVITITSGNREQPLSTHVHDQFYVLRDPMVGVLKLKDGEKADGIITADPNSLMNVTENELQEAASYEEREEIKADMRDKKGWVIDLAEPEDVWIGEKGVASTLIVDKTVYFTTYVPFAESGEEEEEEQCAPQKDKSRLYAIDLLTGGAAFNLDKSSEDKDRSDRHKDLGTGMVGDLITLFSTEEGDENDSGDDSSGSGDDDNGSGDGTQNCRRKMYILYNASRDPLEICADAEPAYWIQQ